jgi:DNA polymerase (family X)
VRPFNAVTHLRSANPDSFPPSARAALGNASGVEPTNEAIADRLLSYSALLDLADASPYASRAYRRAAEIVRTTPGPVAKLVRQGRVRELRGIGPGIERRLRELVETGDIAELRELEDELNPELVGLGRLLGLSSRRVLEIGQALDVRTATELRAAAEEGRLTSVPGVGKTTESRILTALAAPPRAPRGLTVNSSRPLTQAVADALGGHIAGDPRRYRELSFDLAVVCAGGEPAPVLDAFARLPLIVAIVEREEDRAVGVTVEGVPIELVVAHPSRFGTELVCATGSPEYVASLGPLPDAATEEAVYEGLGLPWRPPELREAPPCAVPETLIERGDIRGDLHCHTTWSDGRASVLEMGEAARDRGYEYLAICDHTAAVRVVTGLTADEVRRQAEEIARANEALAPFRVLRGIECDIRPDGTLDLDDDVLAGLDWVQISLHAGQRRSGEDLTRIVTEAMRNPHASALSHPKGRLLNHRPENALDLDAVFAVAVETGLALEINGLPNRLDLSGEHAAEALAAGVDLVLNSDSHSTGGLASIEYSVATARRAATPRERVVNARPLSEIAR